MNFGNKLDKCVKVIMFVDFMLCADFTYKIDVLFALVLVILVIQIC